MGLTIKGSTKEIFIVKRLYLLVVVTQFYTCDERIQSYVLLQPLDIIIMKDATSEVKGISCTNFVTSYETKIISK